ncbi:glycosyltransferase family 2 protein [Paenibacillus sp. M1]|uniref:Glycosyltransferase family 2 protein n=1 Tax=Paenibacillus haidiansis TaxID=1574488 RepID=A0ABU7VWK5_9BACL
MSAPKFLVLLSTYNGEKFIEEQLDSVLKQQEIELHILIRDDGSTDNTVSLIKRYMNSYTGNISLLEAENIGAKGSFFELIELAFKDLPTYDFFAFCDQDDIWNSQKLNRAADILKKEPSYLPLMYCSATQMVASDLTELSIWPAPPKKKLSFYNALVENVAVGCTTVLNQNAFKLIASSLPKNINHVIMHDWWAYLCISSFGKVVFDDQPFILYRQHANNVLGGQTDNLIKKWKKRFQRYFKGQNHYIISNQAEEFFKCFNNQLDEKKQQDLKKFILSTKKASLPRLIYVLQSPFYRQSVSDWIILKIVFLIGNI